MKATLITDWTIGDICKGFQYNEYEGKVCMVFRVS